MNVIPSAILHRYIVMLEPWEAECQPEPGTSNSHLKWMLYELQKQEMPADKANRWLGFVQGTLINRGFTTVTRERNWTRPHFNP